MPSRLQIQTKPQCAQRQTSHPVLLCAPRSPASQRRNRSQISSHPPEHTASIALLRDAWLARRARLSVKSVHHCSMLSAHAARSHQTLSGILGGNHAAPSQHHPRYSAEISISTVQTRPPAHAVGSQIPPRQMTSSLRQPQVMTWSHTAIPQDRYQDLAAQH